MEKSTKIILALAGIGAIGYIAYKKYEAVAVERDKALTHDALSFLTARQLDQKVAELTATKTQAELVQKQAVATGDSAQADAAKSVIENANAGVALVQKAVLSSRKKTEVYGKPAIKSYQNLLNAIRQAASLSHMAINIKKPINPNSIGLVELVPDGEWGPKTQSVSNAYLLLRDKCNGLALDNPEIEKRSNNKEFSLLDSVNEVVGENNTGRDSVEKNLVLGAAKVLRSRIAPADIELIALTIEPPSNG